MSIEFGSVVICNGCGCFGPGAHNEADAIKAAEIHGGWFRSEGGRALYCPLHGAAPADEPAPTTPRDDRKPYNAPKLRELEPDEVERIKKRKT